MIAGDIDLTENMDFRRDKPEEKLLPGLIPWKRKNNITDKGNISIGNNDTYYVYNFQFNNSNSTISYNINSNSYSITRRPSTYSINDSTLYLYDDLDSTTWYSTSSTITGTSNMYALRMAIRDTYSEINDIKPLYPELSNAELISMSDKLPWSIKKFKKPIISTRFNKKDTIEIENARWVKISRRKRNQRRGLFWDETDIENNAYWDIRTTIEEKLNKYLNQLVKYNRIAVPWLQDLHSWIYEDYQYSIMNGKDKDLSSYLTNLGWLRMR